MSEPSRVAPASLGRHALADFFGCRRIPSAAPALERLLREAAEQIGAQVIRSTSHAFAPQGLSAVVVIAESHLSAHTWPEHEAVCVDVFTCSPQLDPDPAIAFLAAEFLATETQTTEVQRGARPLRLSQGASAATPAAPTTPLHGSG